MSSFLAKFFRILIAIVILICSVGYIIYFYSDSLVFITDFDRKHQLKTETQNVATKTSDHKETQTVNNLEAQKPLVEIAPEIKSQNIKKSGEYNLCLKALNSFNSIGIKFLQNQSCRNEIINLKSFDLPQLIHLVLDEISELCYVETEDLIENEMLSQIFQVKKAATIPHREIKFLAKMDKLKVYFYSEDFIKLCKQ